MNKTRLIFIFLCLWTFNSIAQKDSVLLRLNYYEAIAKNPPSISDSSVVKEILDEAANYLYREPTKSEPLAKKALKLARKIGFKTGVGNSMITIANTKMIQNQLDSGDYYSNAALQYGQKNNLPEIELKSLKSQGNMFFFRSEYDQALQKYFESAEIAEKHFETELPACYGSIGIAFRVIGNDEKSEEYMLKGYRLAILYKDTSNQMFCINNLGIIEKNRGNYEASADYYLEGIELAKLTKNITRESELSFNLANTYFLLQDTATGLTYLERSIEITEIIGSVRDRSQDHQNLGSIYYSQKRFGDAIKHGKLGLYYAKIADYQDLKIESSEVLAYSFYGNRQYREAYDNLLYAYFLKDSINFQGMNSSALELEKSYELEQIALEDSLMKKQVELEKRHQTKLSKEQLKSRDTLLWSSVLVIVLIIVALYFMIRSRSQLKVKNAIITEGHVQIQHQKEELIEQHKEIRDSINYAKRIQSALLSGNEEWAKISQEHFILFNPKDVVSGDFYWAHHFDKEDISIWVTADCTGHGVPGAFMSMLGIGFLNEIVIENGTKSGPEILNLLRAKIIKALAQKSGGQQQKDGMDLALCIWDRKSNQLEFTGANNPLWILRKRAQIETENHEKTHFHEGNEYGIIELAANKMPVGFHTETAASFKSQTFELREDDRIISFTDGYADQFGGDKGKKLKYKPFKNMLIEIQSTPIQLQGEKLSDLFEKWIGEFEQIDDVCLIGVKV